MDSFGQICPADPKKITKKLKSKMSAFTNLQLGCETVTNIDRSSIKSVVGVLVDCSGSMKSALELTQTNNDTSKKHLSKLSAVQAGIVAALEKCDSLEDHYCFSFLFGTQTTNPYLDVPTILSLLEEPTPPPPLINVISILRELLSIPQDGCTDDQIREFLRAAIIHDPTTLKSALCRIPNKFSKRDPSARETLIQLFTDLHVYSIEYYINKYVDEEQFTVLYNILTQYPWIFDWLIPALPAEVKGATFTGAAAAYLAPAKEKVSALETIENVSKWIFDLVKMYFLFEIQSKIAREYALLMIPAKPTNTITCQTIHYIKECFVDSAIPRFTREERNLLEPSLTHLERNLTQCCETIKEWGLKPSSVTGDVGVRCHKYVEALEKVMNGLSTAEIEKTNLKFHKDDLVPLVKHFTPTAITMISYIFSPSQEVTKVLESIEKLFGYLRKLRYRVLTQCPLLLSIAEQDIMKSSFILSNQLLLKITAVSNFYATLLTTNKVKYDVLVNYGGHILDPNQLKADILVVDDLLTTLTTDCQTNYPLCDKQKVKYLGYLSRLVLFASKNVTRLVTKYDCTTTVTHFPLHRMKTLLSLQYSGNNSGNNSARNDKEDKNLAAFWDYFQPVIYGSTPMCGALRKAANLMNIQGATQTIQKAMIIISDGDSTDNLSETTTPMKLCEEMKATGQDVTIITCVLAESDLHATGRRLFYQETSQMKSSDSRYNEAIALTSSYERDMFHMSSIISVGAAPIIALIQKGWKVPSSGYCHLFFRTNNRELLHEFCELIHSITYSTNAIQSTVGLGHLSLYIDSKKNTFRQELQRGGTCYAHAIAGGLVLGRSRIVGVDAPVLQDVVEMVKRKNVEQKLRNELSQTYNTKEKLRNALHPSITLTDGEYDECCRGRYNTLMGKLAQFELPPTHKLNYTVLETGGYCEPLLTELVGTFRLHYKVCATITEARQAVFAGRAVVTKFQLHDCQWHTFAAFFNYTPEEKRRKNTPRKILSEMKPPPTNHTMCNKDCGGHAVLLVGCELNSLTFANSWGTDWADDGMFRVSDKLAEELKFEFFDIYWTEKDLTNGEKDAYARWCEAKLNENEPLKAFSDVMENWKKAHK